MVDHTTDAHTNATTRVEQAPEATSSDGFSVSIAGGYLFAQVPKGMYQSNISPTAIKVWCGLWDHGQSPTNCRPSHELLAQEVRLSRATVQRAITELADHGYVVVSRRRRADGNWTANGYELHPTPCITGEAPSDPPCITSEAPPCITGDAAELDQYELDQYELEPGNDVSHLSKAEEPTPAATLAHHLADCIAASVEGAKRPTVTKAWVQTMDRMLRLDHRTPEQVQNCIDWVFTHPAAEFWVPNIHSPQKLRHHYDRLKAEAIRVGKLPKPKEDFNAMLDRVLGAEPAPVEIDLAPSQRVMSLIMSPPQLFNPEDEEAGCGT